MAFQLSHPQGKMYKAARRRFLFLFLETANPLKGSWCLERECLWAEKKAGRRREVWDGVGVTWSLGCGERGTLNRRERGGREYVFDSKKKRKSQSGPPVLCRTFSFDPPLLSTPPLPPHTHTQPHRVQQICRISHQRAFSISCTEMHAS